MTYGEITNAVFENFVGMLAEVYYPVVSRQDDWGKASSDSVREFVSNMGRFVSNASETTKVSFRYFSFTTFFDFLFFYLLFLTFYFINYFCYNLFDCKINMDNVGTIQYVTEKTRHE